MSKYKDACMYQATHKQHFNLNSWKVKQRWGWVEK